jgi:RAMP superfamily
MGGQSVRSDMPNTRKHEIFLPMKYFEATTAEGKKAKSLAPIKFKTTLSSGAVVPQEQLDYFARGTFPIQAVALERFKSLAKKSTHTQDKKPNLGVNALLPYHPIGTRRNSNDTRELELKAGDLVYFRPSSDGTAVAEIAFSSIWRSRVESDGKAVSTKAFFQQISTELAPFSKERERISPAELMLGFVQVADKKATQSQADVDKKTTDPEVIAMASKVRFSFGEFGTASHEPRMAGETTLKILGAPKLPSPALYFKRRSAGNVNKAELSKNAKEFAPRGRKFYLHAMRQSGNVSTINQQGRIDTKGYHPWKSHAPAHDKNNNQRTCINPLAAGETFYCHIDFDNLSQTELALLCFAVKPLEGFEHRLGLGKSLGLGSIEVQPVAMGLIDRVQRYAIRAMSAARFDMLWQSGTVGELPTRYKAMQASPSAGTTGNLFAELATAGAKATQSRDPALLRAINLLGHPDAVKLPVHTPQLEGLDLEGESFKWFVDNEGDTRHHKGAPQNLGAVDSRREALPGMERVKRYERQDR